MSIFTYKGQEPAVVKPAEVSKILDIIVQQLDVMTAQIATLKGLATSFIVIPEGTKLTKVDQHGD